MPAGLCDHQWKQVENPPDLYCHLNVSRAMVPFRSSRTTGRHEIAQMVCTECEEIGYYVPKEIS